MRLSHPAALLLLIPALACRNGPPAPAGSPPAAAPPVGRAIDSLVPDTHLFDLADRTEVWLIPGRVARSASGTPCLERGIQLRKGPLKITVPLLFTSAPPEEVDGMLVAVISNDCVLGDRYRIDVATGQPTKLESRAR